MRKDMFKVIVERPRQGVRGAPRVKLRHDPLPDRTKVGMRRFAQEQRRSTKWLNENLAPLRRYIWKQRGRPWNQVYSEICRHLDTRSTLKQHVRDHLEDLIIIRVVVGKDGVLLTSGGWPVRMQPLHEAWHELYVDPRDGIIKDVATLRRKRGLPVSRKRACLQAPPPNKDVVAPGDREELRRIAGIWYCLRYLPPAAGDRAFRDDWPIAEKRQLSKAELRKHGLRNEENI